MKKNRCFKCWNWFEAHFKSNVCESCEIEKEFGFPTMVKTESLHTMKNVSVNRLKELHKRVLLPDNVKDKDYVCGSMNRGKITDRQVDLTP